MNGATKGITPNRLKIMCEHTIARGNGDKEILISSDDEGNEFHTLWFGFTDDTNCIEQIKENSYFHDDQKSEDVVLLG